MAQFWPEGFNHDRNLKAVIAAVKQAPQLDMSARFDDESDQYDREKRPFKAWLATLPQVARGSQFEMLRLDSSLSTGDYKLRVDLFAVANDDIIDGRFDESDPELTRVTVRKRADVSEWELRPSDNAILKEGVTGVEFATLLPQSLSLVVRFKNGATITLRDRGRAINTEPTTEGPWRPDVIDVVEYLSK